MSTNETRKLTSILKSIEVIEKQANAIHSEFFTNNNDIDHLQPIYIDDINTNLQKFFQYLEQLLQVDLRNRKSMLNTKRNYWNFFVLALKESKGLYDTALYVLNSQEVKTSTGRGRLFLRFCLQNHRLGDAIQQSFMMTKIVHQFYHEDCFWTKQVYMDRIVQALYLLNDVQFDLLSASQYQLDVCWPSGESIDFRPKSFSDSISRLRNDSISSMLSMDSIASPSLVSSSFPIMLPFQNLESSMTESSYNQSMCSIDEYQENSIHYWKDRCQQLELQLQSTRDQATSNDVEIQCSFKKDNQTTQTNEVNLIDENILKAETKKFKSQNDILQDEINNLNFQLSTLHIQRTASENKVKDLEREATKHQSILEAKDSAFNNLQRKFDEQGNSLKSAQEQQAAYANKQDKKIENLNKQLEKLTQLLENERESTESERLEQQKIQEQLEASLHERTLDFEEMKRRLVKAIREKADMFNSIYAYEVKLEEEQSKQWMHEDDVFNCSKCATAFGWTVRKYRCRHCQKIYCYSCSNHWHSGSTPNSQHRYCDFCHEKKVNENLMYNYTILDDQDADSETNADVSLKFEVRAERLNSTADNESISQEQ